MTSQESVAACETKSKKQGMLSKPYAYLNKLAKNLKLSKSTARTESDLLTGKLGSETEIMAPKEDSVTEILKKKSLVLDLDKTLLVTSMEVTKYPSYPVKVMYMGEECIFYVARRPGAYSFVEELSKYYEISIFTTSLPEYAAAMIEFLCIGSFIKNLFHRDHCGRINGTTLFKNLRKVGNTLDNIIFIDDSPIQVSHFRSNSIHILAFEGDSHDQELYGLIEFLKAAAVVPDVRPIEDRLKVFSAGGNVSDVVDAKVEPPMEPMASNSDPEMKHYRISRNFTIPKPREMKLLSHVDIKDVKTIDVTLTPLSGASGQTASTCSSSKLGSNLYYTTRTKKVSVHGFEEFEIAEMDEYTQIKRVPTLEINTSAVNRMMI